MSNDNVSPEVKLQRRLTQLAKAIGCKPEAFPPIKTNAELDAFIDGIKRNLQARSAKAR